MLIITSSKLQHAAKGNLNVSIMPVASYGFGRVSVPQPSDRDVLQTDC
ncbi:MAG: hypothetical protein HRT45_06410 [Bdellovibrionales bacterium]|nr:hypothetical protein [Bdellovibrionales bacterium]